MGKPITKKETGRSPRCDKCGLKKGPWTPEEDQKLVDYIAKNGPGSWKSLPKHAGLNRCDKSSRLRWTNYLRPGIKRGKFSQEEEQTILDLHAIIGNKWSAIASHLPGRTDNGVKNIWNTRLKKMLIRMGYDPMTHQPREQLQPQEALTNTSSVNSSTFTNMDKNNHIINNLPMEQQFPSTMSCFEIGGLQLVYDDGSFSHHMPYELKTCAQQFSYDTAQVTETIAFSHGESSASYPWLLSCSSTTASPSHVAPPVTETSLTNMTDNCNASGLYMAPDLLIEDPLFNVIA